MLEITVGSVLERNQNSHSPDVWKRYANESNFERAISEESCEAFLFQSLGRIQGVCRALETFEACIICEDELDIGVFGDVAFPLFGKFRINLGAMRYGTHDAG